MGRGRREVRAALDVASATGAMHDIYERPPRPPARVLRRDRPARRPDRRARARSAGRLIVLDHVSRPDVFAALHGPLVQGYALDALEAGGRRAARARRSTAARRSCADVLGARVTRARRHRPRPRHPLRRPRRRPAPGSSRATSSSSSPRSPTACRTSSTTVRQAVASAGRRAAGRPNGRRATARLPKQDAPPMRMC